MKDLIQNILSNPIEYPYVPAHPLATGAIDADSPFDRVRASGAIATGDNYPELAELAVAEFRRVFAEIETPGFSWDIRHDLEGNEMHVQVYLTHANGLPAGALPPLDHPTNALWDALGMGHYDKHSRVGNDTEVRMWMVDLDEQFSVSSDIFDRLIGDDGDYSFEGMSLEAGMKALVSALKAKFEANPDPRFKREVDHFEMGDGYALYVYAIFPSAADRIAYEAQCEAYLERVRYHSAEVYIEECDEDPAFDCLDMPWAAKCNLARTAGSDGDNAISRLWTFGLSQ